MKYEVDIFEYDDILEEAKRQDDERYGNFMDSERDLRDQLEITKRQML